MSVAQLRPVFNFIISSRRNIIFLKLKWRTRNVLFYTFFFHLVFESFIIYVKENKFIKIFINLQFLSIL